MKGVGRESVRDRREGVGEATSEFSETMAQDGRRLGWGWSRVTTETASAENR